MTASFARRWCAGVSKVIVVMLLFGVGCMPAPPKAKRYTCALYASCGPVMRISTIEIDVRDNAELADELVTWGQSCSAIALLETEDGECPWVLCDALCEPTWRAEAGADAS